MSNVRGESTAVAKKIGVSGGLEARTKTINDGDSQGKPLVLGFTMTSDGFGCVLTEHVSTTVSIAMVSLV